MLVHTQMVLFATLTTLDGGVGRAAVPALDTVDYDAIEVVVPGNVRYNSLVCSGIRMLEQGRFRDAARYLEEASSLHLFEYPNFIVLPRLALAYWQLGDKSRALEILEWSRLSLSIWIGIYRCKEHSTGFRVVDRYGRDVEEPGILEATRRMCGGIYDSLYVDDEFEAYLSNAQLVQHHVDIARLIRGN